MYLSGLGYVREQLITAREILNKDGKKKYESYIKDSIETISAQFITLKPYYLDILTDLMDIPFRRSSKKDRREVSDSLCLITSLIEEYRYRGADERYREYARTIVHGVDTEHLPPMIAGLIIQEVTTLVDAASFTEVMTYVRSGITHEEYWRYIDPENYAETYDDSEINEEFASPLEALDIYPPHSGIAQQSLWYGLDDSLDNFIMSLAGGLFYSRYPLTYPS
ncbi:hypothetical protein [Superficieibacter sp.]|uniref:hypothetical protein n=1 Tax=Superficieibacter sp. TaxID=2303322 RepID=UPI0028A7EA72|nr:hypothetical protein [Superficieibacter sp.]